MLTLSLLNHLIERNPDIKEKLRAYYGITVCIDVLGFCVHGRIGDQGFFKDSDDEAEVIIRLHASTLEKIFQGYSPGVGDVSLEGNTKLAMTLLPLLDGLKYHAKADLSCLLGEEIADSVMTEFNKVGQIVKEISNMAMQSFRSYVREPNTMLIGQDEFEYWAQEVTTLRDDVARLQARCNKLDSKE